MTKMDEKLEFETNMARISEAFRGCKFDGVDGRRIFELLLEMEKLVKREGIPYNLILRWLLQRAKGELLLVFRFCLRR